MSGMAGTQAEGQSQEVSVIGSLDFIAGFALAGVRRAIEASPENARQKVAEALAAGKEGTEGTGIVIMQESMLSGFSAREKEKLLDTPSPLVMFISESQEVTLQSAIKKALGIDVEAMLKRMNG